MAYSCLLLSCSPTSDPHASYLFLSCVACGTDGSGGPVVSRFFSVHRFLEVDQHVTAAIFFHNPVFFFGLLLPLQASHCDFPSNSTASTTATSNNAINRRSWLSTAVGRLEVGCPSPVTSHGDFFSSVGFKAVRSVDTTVPTSKSYAVWISSSFHGITNGSRKRGTVNR